MLGLEVYGICFHLDYIGIPNYILLPLGLQINDNPQMASDTISA